MRKEEEGVMGKSMEIVHVHTLQNSSKNVAVIKCNENIKYNDIVTIIGKKIKSAEGTNNTDYDNGSFRSIITSMCNENNGNDEKKSDISQVSYQSMYGKE